MHSLDNFQNRCKGPREVFQPDGQLGNSTFYRKTSHDDLIQYIHIDIAAGNDGQNLPPFKSYLMI